MNWSALFAACLLGFFSVSPCFAQSSPRSDGGDGLASSADQAAGVAGEGGAGGGSVADFGSLMALIETTVAPETWESLGGPSGMFPYPQGVYVDASGTLHPCERLAGDDTLDDLNRLLADRDAAAADDRDDWRSASAMRFVSLRRLLEQRLYYDRNRIAAPQSMVHLAGLSRVQYAVLIDNDIVIAGPVGGVESHHGWFRDPHSGRVAARFDFFVTCLAAALSNQPFGCTIDPTTEGLQNASRVAEGIKNNSIPLGTAAGALTAALGMQQIEVFGTAGDTPLGYVMVEADRHMKQLALGVHPMPRGAKNYLDAIDQTISQGPPQDLLLRLWFTSRKRSVRADAERQVFELGGAPIQLSGQNERAVASGQRGNFTTDPRTEIFVDDFNKHWPEIRSQYPIYAALESVFQSASLSELLRRIAVTPAHRELLSSLADIDTTSAYLMATPRQVESIAVLHTVQHRRQKHHILIASGGVAVDSKQTLTSSVADYPSIRAVGQPAERQPRVIQRWWWDR